MKKWTVIFLTGLFCFVMVWAGHKQTNPKNHKHVVWNMNNKPIEFEPLLRIGWKGNNTYLDQVKFEIKNCNRTFSITIGEVRVIDSAGNTVWSESANLTIPKNSTGKKEWRDDIVEDEQINRNGAVLEYDIDCGGRTWCLHWDPSVSGSASTTVDET